MFTIHTKDLSIIENMDKTDVLYIAYQLEQCPKTKNLHIQGYIELGKPCRISKIKKLMDCQHVHLEKRRGTQEQAINYCSKSESRILGPYFYGEPSKQGKRTDLECVEELKINSLSTFAEEHPDIFLKYGKNLKELKTIYESKELKQRDIKVFIIIGAPGIGKTKYVYDKHPIEHIYSLEGDWFDGYYDQPVLLIDDYDGKYIKYTQLLKMCDRYPFRCNVKGSSTQAKWTTVYITSNESFASWYDGSNLAALRRRVTEFILLEPKI